MEHKTFIVRKTVKASSIADALKKEKKIAVDSITPLDEENHTGFSL